MPNLSSFCAAAIALEAAFDDEGRDALRAAPGLDRRVDHGGVGLRAVRDPHLGTVQDPAAVATLGARAHRDHVGARARLAHGERADVFAGDQPRQEALLLLVVAEAPQLVDAEVGMRAVGEADRARSAADLLHGDDVFQVAEPEPAILFRHRHAEQAHVAHFGPKLARKAIAAVDLVGLRRNATQGEFANRLAQFLDARGQAEIELNRGHAVLRPAGLGLIRESYCPTIGHTSAEIRKYGTHVRSRRLCPCLPAGVRGDSRPDSAPRIAGGGGAADRDRARPAVRGESLDGPGSASQARKRGTARPSPRRQAAGRDATDP